MMPLWSFLVSLGAWAQVHQSLMLGLTLSAFLVILVGLIRSAWRVSSLHRGPRL